MMSPSFFIAIFFGGVIIVGSILRMIVVMGEYLQSSFYVYLGFFMIMSGVMFLIMTALVHESIDKKFTNYEKQN